MDTSDIIYKISKKALFETITLQPHPTHLKDANTGKYIYSNKLNYEFYGLNDASEIIGLSIKDLDGFMRPFWGERFSDEICNSDNQIKLQGRPLYLKDNLFLDRLGFVHYQDMLKTPIFDMADSKVIAVVTTSHDKTETAPKSLLFKFYQKHFTLKKLACQMFMRHLKIEQFFEKVLSEKEIICILHMLENHSHEYVAQKMSVAKRTIESHCNNIQNKIIKSSLKAIISSLRKTEVTDYDI